jgi:predicted RecB family nuclease
LEGDQDVSHHSLWADTAADEEGMWRSFLDILSAIDHPVLIHYGRFETTFLKRLCDRYGGPPEDSAVAKAISSSVNVLSVIFAQVYFSTYSNGLKEIAQFLGFEWGDPSSSGLQSITWRHDWEASGDPTVREKLIAYNADDCKALCLVARTLGQISQPQSDTGDATGSKSDIIRAESLGKNLTSKWGPF